MFVRYVSHEIRTPLSAVVVGMNYLKKLFELKYAALDPDTMDVVEEVHMSCEAAVDILNDLLTYEKLDGGLLETYFKRESAYDFVRCAIKPFNQQVSQNGILLFRGLNNHNVLIVFRLSP